MRTIKITAAILLFLTTFAHAQNSSDSSKSNSTRTIEINNDNGDLYISFVNKEITEFIINDTPVAKDRYEDYADIIEEFANEEDKPVPPSTPAPQDTDETAQLYDEISEYLVSKDLINTEKKFKIHLNSKYLKVNKDKSSAEVHQACLDIFEKIYGHKLNARSDVKFRKKKNSYKSSVTINL